MVVGHVRQELDWEDCDDLDDNEDDVIGLTLFQPFTERHQVSCQQEPTEPWKTGSWLADNQSRDLNNESWLVNY